MLAPPPKASQSHKYTVRTTHHGEVETRFGRLIFLPSRPFSAAGISAHKRRALQVLCRGHFFSFLFFLHDVSRSSTPLDPFCSWEIGHTTVLAVDLDVDLVSCFFVTLHEYPKPKPLCAPANGTDWDSIVWRFSLSVDDSEERRSPNTQNTCSAF